MRLLRRVFAAFCWLIGAASATELTPPPKTDANGWIVTVSVTGAVAPSFPGSGQMRPYPFPSVSFRKVGEPELFSTPDEGFGLALIDLGYLRAGPVANFVFQRGQRDGLFGLRRIGLTHEVGGFVEVNPLEHVRLRAELRQGVDGHRGFVAALYADAYQSFGRFRVSAGPRLNFGDNIYANAYFSVTPFEALINGRLTPYNATGGFTSAGGMATVRYDFDEWTSVSVFGGGQRLLGGVGGSPIPNLIGSRSQYTAGLSVARSFEVRNPFPF
ncbi:MipA/OmpV family protein [Methylocystis sp. WRRC1]|uniref:MipA/OmpV family protein n=1 Tax=Methylocystis sp. WRRC1 TaxID=1732014 RepID=UPI001D15CD1F|nr:MipA/OmpV family protein [Methylocystis sp. WRRC1]MCC3245250.1 MipA/OmpV family protein [Methylocystis sp. WRRC1]